MAFATNHADHLSFSKEKAQIVESKTKQNKNEKIGPKNLEKKLCISTINRSSETKIDKNTKEIWRSEKYSGWKGGKQYNSFQKYQMEKSIPIFGSRCLNYFHWNWFFNKSFNSIQLVLYTIFIFNFDFDNLLNCFSQCNTELLLSVSRCA